MNNVAKNHQYRLDLPQPVDVNLTLFSNQLLVVVSQLNKFGSVIQGSCVNVHEAFNVQDHIYEIKTVFGSRQFEIYELYGRAIMDIMYDKDAFFKNLEEKYKVCVKQAGNPFFGKDLTLMICTNPSEDQNKLFKCVIDSIKANIVNLF